MKQCEIVWITLEMHVCEKDMNIKQGFTQKSILKTKSHEKKLLYAVCATGI